MKDIIAVICKVVLLNSYCDRAHEKKVNQMRAELEHYAKERFNIVNYNGTPVITYNGVIITVPDQNLSGDELIRQLMELRRIYVEK